LKSQPDIETEMLNLQKTFFLTVPNSLELIDMHADYVNLAAFVYDLRDLCKILVRMGEALR